MLFLVLATLLLVPAALANDALSWSSDSEASDVCRKQALEVLGRDFSDLSRYTTDLAKGRRLQRRLEAHLARNKLPITEGHTGAFPLKQVSMPPRAAAAPRHARTHTRENVSLCKRVLHNTRHHSRG